MVPIGFVSDHMEVIWDLDTVAVQAADEVGLPVARAVTPGTDPRFVAMVADLLAEQRTRLDGPPAGLPGLRAAWVGGLGPRAVPCAAGCCPNPRGPRPSLCGSDGA
jgi:ferrochelatase